MSEVSRFGHEEFGTIRTVDVDGEVWFVAKDVTDALGYREAYDALESHVRPGQRANRVVAGAGSGIAATPAILTSGSRRGGFAGVML